MWQHMKFWNTNFLFALTAFSVAQPLPFRDMMQWSVNWDDHLLQFWERNVSLWSQTCGFFCRILCFSRHQTLSVGDRSLLQASQFCTWGPPQSTILLEYSKVFPEKKKKNCQMQHMLLQNLHISSSLYQSAHYPWHVDWCTPISWQMLAYKLCNDNKPDGPPLLQPEGYSVHDF